MSGDASNWVYRHSPYRGATFQVHHAIGDTVNDMNNNEFWMRLKELSAKARVGERAAWSALQTLIADQYIEVVTEGGGRGKLSSYRFLFPEVPVVFNTRVKRRTQREVYKTETSHSDPETSHSDPETSHSVQTLPLKNSMNSNRTQGLQPSKSVAPAAGAETWKAYAEAFNRRYGTDPVRNATVNAQCAQLVKRLGSEEAPFVAAFFVSHNNSYYIQRGHSLGILLADAEKVRTEWATGRKTNSTIARETERMESNGGLRYAARLREERLKDESRT